VDIRTGWRVTTHKKQAMELFLDIFNITNRANFENPVAANRNQRQPTSFLVLTNLYGGGGFPRQAYFGVRYVF
jgi:hypothetical protein